jgi:hypothetical protein
MSEKLVCRELVNKKLKGLLSFFDMSAQQIKQIMKTKVLNRVDKSYMRDTLLKLVGDETNQVSSRA